MLTFYFTGTGNSLAAAKKIGGTLNSIPQAIHEENKIYRDDAIGFVFPLYCLNPPKMVREFLQNAKFEADYFFAVATYGNATGAALPHLQRAAEELGLRFDYINALLAVDNCLPHFEMNEEIAKLPAKRTEECLEQIAADIAARKRFIPAATAEDEALSAYCEPLLREPGQGRKRKGVRRKRQLHPLLPLHLRLPRREHLRCRAGRIRNSCERATPASTPARRAHSPAERKERRALAQPRRYHNGDHPRQQPELSEFQLLHPRKRGAPAQQYAPAYPCKGTHARPNARRDTAFSP